MDKKELYRIEEELHKGIKGLEAEQKKYVEGMKEGISMTVDAVRDALNRELGVET